MYLKHFKVDCQCRSDETFSTKVFKKKIKATLGHFTYMPTRVVDLSPWLGGMIGAKLFSAMDQNNQEVEAWWQVAPLPSKLLTFSSHPR